MLEVIRREEDRGLWNEARWQYCGVHGYVGQGLGASGAGREPQTHASWVDVPKIAEENDKLHNHLTVRNIAGSWVRLVFKNNLQGLTHQLCASMPTQKLEKSEERTAEEWPQFCVKPNLEDFRIKI